MNDLQRESKQNGVKTQIVEISNYFASAICLALAVYISAKGLHSVIVLVIFLLAFLFLVNGLYLRKKSNYTYTKTDLETKMEEKEMLLKEVHHRVKNNLQTVSSLLSLQSRSLNDKKVQAIIKSSQHRVVSMSIVHEMLYKRDIYSSKMEFTPYVEELCGYLIRSLKGNTNKIDLKLDLGNFMLSVDTIIPLGLIINEAITNSLKYGIPGDEKGTISISLTKKGATTYEMYLGDDGIGFPEDIDPKNTSSLGLKLIHNLARQLKGTVNRDTNADGTYYQLDFEEIVQDFHSVD